MTRRQQTARPGAGEWRAGEDRRQNTGGARVQVPTAVEPLLKRFGTIAARRGIQTYAVGGCVRDWYLGLATAADVDIAVEGGAIDLAQAVARAVGAAATVHRQFGTATLRMTRGRSRAEDGSPVRIDFAMCRTETYAKPAAYPRVSPGTIEDDLFRRDFTINAIAVAIAPARFGALVDPFHGAQDVRRGWLRVLHDRSFRDDPSRILRGVRFAQRFGFRWEDRTGRLVRDAVAAGALGWLNAGRLEKELALMLDEPDPLACFRQLAALLEPMAAHGEPVRP